MRSRRKRVRRRDGSVYVMNPKREMWKSRRVGVNRMVQGSMDWTKQSVWSWRKREGERRGKKGSEQVQGKGKSKG
jgi:hypothetical protein